MATTYIRGDAVANAKSYKLYEKTGPDTYVEKAEANDINFDMSTVLGLADGPHTMVVKAIGDGVNFEDSDYSNEVVYTAGAVGYNLTVKSHSETGSGESTYLKVGSKPTSANDYTAANLTDSGLTGAETVSGVTKVYLWGYAYCVGVYDEETNGYQYLTEHATYDKPLEITLTEDTEITLVAQDQ